MTLNEHSFRRVAMSHPFIEPRGVERERLIERWRGRPMILADLYPDLPAIDRWLQEFEVLTKRGLHE